MFVVLSSVTIFSACVSNTVLLMIIADIYYYIIAAPAHYYVRLRFGSF